MRNAYICMKVDFIPYRIVTCIVLNVFHFNNVFILLKKEK